MHLTTNRGIFAALLRLSVGPALALVVAISGCGPAAQQANDSNAGDSKSSADADAGKTEGEKQPGDATDADKTDADKTEDGKTGVAADSNKSGNEESPQPDAAPDVPALIVQVESGDAAKQIEAIDELGKRREEAAPAVPALTNALASDNSDVRWHAARTLGAIGADAKAAVPDLVTALGNKDDAKTRAYAAFALGQIGDKSESPVTALVHAAVDTDPLVRRAVFVALNQLKPPRELTRPLMLKTLEQANPALVAPALHSLAEMGADVVPALVDALDSEKGAYWACLVLAEIGTNGTAGDTAPAAVEGLIKASSNKDPEVRMQAMLALAEYGPAAKPAASRAVEILEKDDFSGAQYAAAFALGRFGVTEGTIEPLEKARESKDSFLQMIAAQALALLKPDDAPTLKSAAVLIAESLGSDDPRLRAAAARALAEFPGSSEITAPILEKAVQEKPELIANAMSAIVELGAKAVPRVTRGLSNPKLRIYAIRILSRIGPDAKEALPAIIDALKNDDGSDPQFRAELQFALGNIGGDSAAAVPQLVKSLDSPDDQVRQSACYALCNMGPAAAAAAERLEQNLGSEDRFLALISVWSLLKIRPGDKEIVAQAIPLLVEGLQYKNEMVQIESVRALGELGPAAKSALPDLQKVEGSEALKQALSEAIKKIEG